MTYRVYAVYASKREEWSKPFKTEGEASKHRDALFTLGTVTLAQVKHEDAYNRWLRGRV